MDFDLTPFADVQRHINSSENDLAREHWLDNTLENLDPTSPITQAMLASSPRAFRVPPRGEPVAPPTISPAPSVKSETTSGPTWPLRGRSVSRPPPGPDSPTRLARRRTSPPIDPRQVAPLSTGAVSPKSEISVHRSPSEIFGPPLHQVVTPTQNRRVEAATSSDTPISPFEALNVDDNSDDDIIMIDIESASLAARKKWSKSKSKAHLFIVEIEEEKPLIKEEPIDDDGVVMVTPPNVSARKVTLSTLMDVLNGDSSRSEAAPVQDSAVDVPDEGSNDGTLTQDYSVKPAAQAPEPSNSREAPPAPPAPPPKPAPAKPAPAKSGPSVAQMLAAQRIMAAKQRQAAQQNPTVSGPCRNHRNPRAPTPRIEPSQSQSQSQSQTTIQDSQATTTTADDDEDEEAEDLTWMEVDHDEGDVEYENLKAREEKLAIRVRNGKITDTEKLQLNKVRSLLFSKDRLRQLGATVQEDENEEPEDMFLEETQQQAVTRRRKNHEQRQQDEEAAEDDMLRLLEQEIDHVPVAAGGKQKTKKKRGAPSGTRRPRNAREVLEFNTAKERSKASKKKPAKPLVTSRAKAAAQKGKGKAAKNGKGSKTTKGKKAGKVQGGSSLLRTMYPTANGDDHVARMILDNLMSNNPISDHQQNPALGAEPEPTIRGRLSKATQFQQLFSNIPDPNSSLAKDDKARLTAASKAFGYAKVKAVDGKWLLKGMKSTLYHHQLLGAQWMVHREMSAQAPQGGLLADSMGLGKTVQTLACMVANRPGPEDKCKATLLVVPAAVISQWMDEIQSHCDPKMFPKVLQYKTSSGIPCSVLMDLDIVVTSYQEVMKQFPFPDAATRQLIARIGYTNWWKEAIKDSGPLHQIRWFRIVLDEAQNIKNNHGRTSLACQNLKGDYRWCLTGTPLLNRLEELFPYLRFLKANYSIDWDTFRKYFCDTTAQDSYSRISTLLSYTMMRRTMKTTILNRPIISLPTPHSKIQYINFSEEEQIIYRVTENRFRANINTFFAQGEARRNYGVFMVQLLRLRQCTSHPFMLEKTIRESWTLEDLAEFKAKIARLNKPELVRKKFYETCEAWVEQGEADRAAALARGEEPLPFGRGHYGHSFNMDRAMQTLNQEELFERVICSICSDIPSRATKTDCGHIFCSDCLFGWLQGRLAEGDDHHTCPYGERIFGSTQLIENLPPHESDEDMSSTSSPSQSHSQSRGTKGKKRKHKVPNDSKGLDAIGYEPFTKDSTWIANSDTDPEFPLAPSAKTAALKAILLKGFQEAPLDKVVIYVQFRALARIVGRMCASEGWKFVYLTGETSFEHRNRAIKMFKDDPDVKILIAGLKCGGIGLNFPWANRCISLDLWWNHAVEQQAFGRIFRIGQSKETYMTRIIIKNSVDMRLLTMQLFKLKNLEKAIQSEDAEEGEGEGGKGRGKGRKESLSLKQLANLFGFLKTDEDGEVVGVEADYDDLEDGEGEGGGGGGGEGYGEGVYGDVMDEGDV